MLRSLFTGGMTFQQIVASLFSVAIVILLCLPLHECAHGFAAKLLGDDTAEREGRLTLNPFAHIDWFGAIAMVVCGIGWAKPVPVNLRAAARLLSAPRMLSCRLRDPSRTYLWRLFLW